METNNQDKTGHLIERKKNLTVWHKRHEEICNHIMVDLSKMSLEGLMHIYCYTAKELDLQYKIEEKNFKFLFKYYFQKCDWGIFGKRLLLINDFILFVRNKTIRQSLEYWLLYDNMYEIIVSKISVRCKSEQERTNHLALLNMKKQFINSSIKNEIKSKEDWVKFNPLIFTAEDKIQYKVLNGKEIKMEQLYDFLKENQTIPHDCTIEKLSDSIYSGNFHQMWMNKETKRVQIKGIIALLSNYFQTDWFDATLDSISQNRADINRQNNKEEFNDMIKHIL